jgi:chromosome segregation protein
VKNGYESLIESLVGHVVLAEDLHSALQLWNRNGIPHTVVTQKGDRVCSQGILIGGSPEAEASGILTKKKEIRELSKRLSKLETSGDKARAAQVKLENETIELESQIQKTRQKHQTKKQEEMDFEKEIYRLGEELKQTQHRLRVLSLEAQQIQGEETDLMGELSKYEEDVSELTRELAKTESAIAETTEEMKNVASMQESVGQKLVGLRLELTRLQAQHESIQNTLQRLSSFKEERLAKLDHLAKQLTQKEQDQVAVAQRTEENRIKIARLYAELETAEKTLSEMEREYEAIEKKLQENERALSDIGSAQQEIVQKIQQIDLKQTERRLRCEHLTNRIRESYHRELESVGRDDEAEAFSVEEMEASLAGYREKIARIGDVNLAAIGEYEALAERYQFLTEQRDDLLQAVEDLRRVIRKINRRSLRQFMRTFKAVNEKLQEVFPSLFEGGTAKLVLTNPRKPLESGVSYYVHPPGKKLTRMSLLSGGEKALSAIALVFSLFLIKPTAFCVFDEIDAPLDDVNTHRFNSLVRLIGQNSQVILVTHNKQTMEVADALFGVTMEDKGVSKLISINLEN